MMAASLYTPPKEGRQEEQNTLWDETRRLVNPHKVYVDLSRKLYDIKIKLLGRVSESHEDHAA